MALEHLSELLNHWDPAVAAQGLALARSLKHAERLALARQVVSQPWQPGQPRQVLRICAHDDATAEQALQDWLLSCLMRAGHRLPPSVDWRELRRAAERYRAGHLSRTALRDVLWAHVARGPYCPPTEAGVQLKTCWRATLAAAEDLCEPELLGGWRTPAMLERLVADGWGRRALLSQAAALTTR